MSKLERTEFDEKTNINSNINVFTEQNGKESIMTAGFNHLSKNTDRSQKNKQLLKMDLYSEPGIEKLENSIEDSVKFPILNNVHSEQIEISKNQNLGIKTVTNLLEENQSFEHIYGTKDKIDNKEINLLEYKKSKTNSSMPVNGPVLTDHEGFNRFNNTSRLNISPSVDMNSINLKLENNLFNEIQKIKEDPPAIILTENEEVKRDQKYYGLENCQNEDDFKKQPHKNIDSITNKSNIESKGKTHLNSSI